MKEANQVKHGNQKANDMSSRRKTHSESEKENIIIAQLSAWGIDTTACASIRDLRLRHIPVVDTNIVGSKSISFVENDNTYVVRYKKAFSKGSNGSMFEAFSTNKSNPENVLHNRLVSKRVTSRLHSLRECINQMLAYQILPKNIPAIYRIFRTKHYFWIFMQDLRITVPKASYSYSLHSWFHNCKNIMDDKYIENATKKVIGTVLKLLDKLQKDYDFMHGDLHTANIIVQGSKKNIYKVYILDFGYTMANVKMSQKEAIQSPYWSTIKDGLDAAIFLWSLATNSSFVRSADTGLLNWINEKLNLSAGNNLMTLTDMSKLYQHLLDIPSEQLVGLSTHELYNDFSLSSS